jgi:ferritin-like metal-binding protein YciE
MATKKMQAVTLEDLLLLKLKALYDIELQLMKALPKMAKKSNDPELKAGFTEHFEETKGHKERLEEIFKSIGQKPTKTKVEAIRGMIIDAEWMMKNIKDREALDASLIAAGQYAEHYEMAGYGSAKEWAKILGLNEIEDLLNQTLLEEKSADQKLNDLATGKINEQAIVPPTSTL